MRLNVIMNFVFLIIIGLSSAFLLPPKSDNQPRSHKDFKNGLVSCGSTFCSPENCIEYCDEHGVTIKECAE